MPVSPKLAGKAVLAKPPYWGCLYLLGNARCCRQMPMGIMGSMGIMGWRMLNRTPKSRSVKEREKLKARKARKVEK